MRVLLEFGYFCLLFFKFTVGLIRIRVLFKGGSLLRIYGMYECYETNFEYFDVLLRNLACLAKGAAFWAPTTLKLQSTEIT